MMLKKTILGKLYFIQYKLMLATNNENQSILLKVLLALQAIGLNFIECEESTCEEYGLNGPGCQCKQTQKPNSLSIFCEGKEVTESDLEIFSSINDNFFALVIQNTGLKTIKEDTFNSSFERIFIENNTVLETIASNSFKQKLNAKYLLIRNNPKLNVADIFELTKALPSVERIEFEGNNLTAIPKNAFSNNTKLKYIFLQRNNIDTIREADTFGELPNLSQIVLEHNKLKEINGLQFMKTTKEHKISVFLNNNNLTETSFKGQKGYEKQENVTVKLFLENNKFESVPRKLEAFLKDSKNELYFLNNEFNCQKEMNWLKQYGDQVFDVWCTNYDESFFRVDI
jgi:hypothetical protein